MPVVIEKDALIIGGGIAGLWLLNCLKSASYRVMLLDKNPLGSGQSVASQGMIHGGIKYALSGSLTSATDAIADMPAHWQACLESGRYCCVARLLSDIYYMCGLAVACVPGSMRSSAARPCVVSQRANQDSRLPCFF